MSETDDFPDPRPPGPDRRDNVASTGLDPDDWERLEEWRTDRRMSRSEGTRQLIRRGLEGSRPTRRAVGLGAAAAGSAYLLLLVYSDMATAGIVAATYIGVLSLWAGIGELTG